MPLLGLVATPAEGSSLASEPEALERQRRLEGAPADGEALPETGHPAGKVSSTAAPLPNPPGLTTREKLEAGALKLAGGDPKVYARILAEVYAVAPRGGFAVRSVLVRLAGSPAAYLAAGFPRDAQELVNAAHAGELVAVG